ncbi:MAG: cytochrome b/b6 domain-containing protein [Erythrobacter sp.]
MKRHAVSTRLWHWLNAGALAVLFMSGLTISNAHRYLYWGNYGYDPADAWAIVMRFPGWITLPTRYNLAAARDWHNTAAWVFALGLLGIWIAMLVNGHFRRNLATRRRDWSLREWGAAIRVHFMIDTASPDDPPRYNALQKIAYGAVYGLMLPVMVLTGLAMSPGLEPAAPWLVEAWGGRQSARSVHFITTWAIVLFAAGHITLALLSRPAARIGAMIRGGKQEGMGA